MSDPAKTILIVDDEPFLRSALAFDFTRSGYKVIEAANGLEAFDIIGKTEVDLVLSDVRMPGGDGVELLDRAKRLKSKSPVFILITGFADLTTEDAYDKGAEAVISKPFDRKELQAAVSRALLGRDAALSFPIWDPSEAQFSVDLEVPSLVQASIKGGSVRLARGGVCVVTNEGLPRVNQKLRFSLRFKVGTPLKLEGLGVVRWVRNKATEAAPSSYGFEFVFINESSRSEGFAALARLSDKCYIPHGKHWI